MSQNPDNPNFEPLAHNCIKNNSIARLMKELYWRDKKAGLAVPAILGLTASPLMRTNLEGLEILETTLDAVCKTPNKHRSELLAQVNRPTMITMRYQKPSDFSILGATSAMESLAKANKELDIMKDPYIRRLTLENTKRNREKLKKAIMRNSTNCRKQLKSFWNVARVIREDLGIWAADYYIQKVVESFLESCNNYKCGVIYDDLNEEERAYVAEALQKVKISAQPGEPNHLTPKAQKLLDVLDSHKDNPVGIIFVKERATVAVLSHFLSVHPVSRDRYQTRSMVGTSTSGKRRRNFFDLSKKEDVYALDEFRSGKINLLVATNVLEEGIDVPACNLVICFDEPRSPKSFIQRRGRARMSASSLYLLIPEGSDKSAESWQAFEAQMKRLYEDEERKKLEYLELEKVDETDGYPVLEVESTGARLTIEDAKRHLENFCATLTSKKYVNTSPYYTFVCLDDKPSDPEQPVLIKATVHLPGSPVPELRRFGSLRSWYSQDYASKDAAFQAYIKLYEVGLVNHNLLPVRESDLLPVVKGRPGLAMVREQLNPWFHVAQEWRKEDRELFRRRLTISNNDGTMSAEFDVVLPVPIPDMRPFTVYWESHSPSPWTVEMSRDKGKVTEGDAAKDHTQVLLAMAFAHRTNWTDVEKQYPVRLVSVNQDIGFDDISAIEPSQELVEGPMSGHLIRDAENNNHPYFYRQWLSHKPPKEAVGSLLRSKLEWAEIDYDTLPEDTPYIAVGNWAKKAGSFRKPVSTYEGSRSGRTYPRILPAQFAKVDRVPAVFAHVGMFLPSIAYALEVHLVASDLAENLLENVGIEDLSLVVDAISSTSAEGPTDYEQVEFLGDAILKYFTTINLTARCKNLYARPENGSDRKTDCGLCFRSSVLGGTTLPSEGQHCF